MFTKMGTNYGAHVFIVANFVFIVKFAVYVKIFEQIIYAKYKNDRAKNNEYTGCTKLKNKSGTFILNVFAQLWKRHHWAEQWLSAAI